MNKKLKTTLIVLLNLLGFPLLIVLVIINASYVVQSGKSYGIYAYAGIILTIGLALLYYAVMLKMKLRKKKSPIKQAIILAIVATLSLTGLWVLVEQGAANKLLDATSGTIYLEDLEDAYNMRADINKSLLNDFIYVNTFGNDNLVYIDTNKDVSIEANTKEGETQADVDNLIYYAPNGQPSGNERIYYKDLVKKEGNIRKRSDKMNQIMQGKYKNNVYIALPKNMSALANSIDPDKKEAYLQGQMLWNAARWMAYHKYQKLGFKSTAVKTLNKGTFASINDDGYTTYTGPWIDMAIGGRLTIPALIHLLLDKREFKNRDMPSIHLGGVSTGAVQWAVLDMMGPPLGLATMEYQDDYASKEEFIFKKKEEKGYNKARNERKSEIEKEIEKEWSKLPKNVTKVPAMAMDLAILSDPVLQDVLQQAEPMLPTILGMVETLIADKAVVGSPIRVHIDAANGKLGLLSANATRGQLGYQNAAWLDANALTYMLSSVMSTRNLYVVFAGIIGFVSILTGILTQKKLHCEEDEDELDNEIEELKKLKAQKVLEI